ncbi:hypothetical protein, partial [Dialister succinatiphilus]|uniref:hypothetical protein n=1 Tax=Dialister succinatiphilus TaxID=487173 RepID=UPI003AB8B45A
WGTMITGIFVFHHNTIIPLKKVSDSFELGTFFCDCFNSIISQPLFLSTAKTPESFSTLFRQDFFLLPAAGRKKGKWQVLIQEFLYSVP